MAPFSGVNADDVRVSLAANITGGEVNTELQEYMAKVENCLWICFLFIT